MTNHAMAVSKRTGQARFRRTEDRDNGNIEDRGEMHRAGVIREQQGAFAQLGDEFGERRLADTIDAVGADRCFDGRADFRVTGCAEQNPLDRPLSGNRNGNLGKAFRKPPLGRAVFGAGTEADLRGRAI